MTSSTASPGASETRPGDVCLSVRDLHTYFQFRRSTVRAVRGVSFDVHRGETLGIVGESGSGKSVTALSIMRLVPAPGRIAGGEIQFGGRDLLRLSEREMRLMRGTRISMILQDPRAALDPVFTVGQQLAEVRGQHSSRSRSVDMLRRLHIVNPEAVIDRYPHQLSGGMNQRVVTAMAMLSSPELLIADEPTTALDVTVQAQILALLKEIQSAHRTAMILITHDLSIVAAVCDTVAVMYGGRLVEYGPVSAIFRNPRHPYTAALLKAIPKATSRAQRLEPIPGQPVDARKLGDGCPFADRCAYVLDVCRQEFPAPTFAGENHWAACWNQQEHY